MTRDGQLLRQWLKELAELLAPKGANGKGVGDVNADDEIAAWATRAAADKALVAAHRRSNESDCTADKRMCAFFAELAPAVAQASGELRGAPPRTVVKRAAGGASVRQGTTKTALGSRITRVQGMIRKLAEKMEEYESILKDLQADMVGAPPGRGPRKAKAAAQAKAKTPATSPAQSATDSSEYI